MRVLSMNELCFVSGGADVSCTAGTSGANCTVSGTVSSDDVFAAYDRAVAATSAAIEAAVKWFKSL